MKKMTRNEFLKMAGTSVALVVIFTIYDFLVQPTKRVYSIRLHDTVY